MPAYRVQWSQPAAVAATVTVDLDELAQWAVEVAGVRTLDGGVPAPGDAAGLRRMLEANGRLRDALLQQWAAAHIGHVGASP